VWYTRPIDNRKLAHRRRRRAGRSPDPGDRPTFLAKGILDHLLLDDPLGH
jgi:hypothetical protein